MTDLLKWEDGGGLKHHCPICQTPLSHEKCRTQCLGVHVEWCSRYHTLFRKNWSSRCSACKTTDEQHEKRHREIAELVAKINKLKAEEAEGGMNSPAPRTPLTAKALKAVDGVTDVNTPRTTKKERKKMKKAAKAMERDKVVTSADILHVAESLHPAIEQHDEEDGTELAEDLDIRMNLKFNNSTCNTKSARGDFIKKDQAKNLKKEQAKKLEETKVDVERVLAVFDMDPKAAGREGKLVGELAAAIQNDLVHYQDELRTIVDLRGAFWRWANARVYRGLVDNGKDWDDQTPKKERSDSTEAFRAPEDAATEDEEEEDGVARNDSMDSGMDSGMTAASASTSFTIPSIKSTASKMPKAKTLTFVTPVKPKEVIGDPGWKQVGKKVLKPPPTGKLKMVKNGGLHHLAKPLKNSFGVLSEAWGEPAEEDVRRLP